MPASMDGESPSILSVSKRRPKRRSCEDSLAEQDDDDDFQDDGKVSSRPKKSSAKASKKKAEVKQTNKYGITVEDATASQKSRASKQKQQKLTSRTTKR